MHMSARTPKSILAGLLSLFLVSGVFGGVLAPSAASADSAPLDPADPATPPTVTADPLPTAQINGVAWAQIVVGNTVYVAGRFSSARPAGAPAGTGEVVRNNLLAYDIRTGALVPSFAPNLNAQAVALAASPDGSRIYVGGDFTQADGQVRYRIAAYSTATGQLIPDFRPAFASRVGAIAATDSTVFAGGWFTAVGTSSRRNLAAVSASNGALLPWAPVAAGGAIGTPSSDVLAMTLTNGGTQVVVGGRFGLLNGVSATGIGALDAATGATRPFAVNQLLTNQGQQSAVYSLTSDSDTVYATGYVFGTPGNHEGSFAAAANGGALKWVNDCHGDTYSSFPSNGALYMATHAHVCSNIGGFPEQSPRVNMFGTAVSLAATGRTGTATLSNQNFAGKPSPSLLPWFPTFVPGTVTGQSQAGWTVAGNSQYVVYGGEFPTVNGAAQQGLVRFAVPALAPNAVAPRANGSWLPTVGAVPGAVRISWGAVSDRDNEYLTYRVWRDAETGTPVCEERRASTWWNLPTFACADTGATPGAHRYLVTATDPAGNRLASGWTAADVPAGSTSAPRPYATEVVNDGALDLWSLGETAGTTAYDRAGGLDLTVNPGVTTGRPGAISGDADGSFQFNGTSTGFLSTRTAQTAPQTFAVEAWFATTSTAGGKVIGFGNSSTGNSGGHDRNVYLDPQGRLSFGVWLGEVRSVSGVRTYNDGAWHHVVASLSRSGMQLYVDGQLVGSRTDTTSGQNNFGYWRVGGDTTWVGSGYLNGRIDEVAVYPAPLTAAQVARHHDLGRAVNTPPTAAFTSTVTDLRASVDATGSTDTDGRVASYAWNFGDGGTAAGVTAAHSYAAPGTYQVTLTITDDDGASATSSRAVTVTAAPTGPGSIAADAFERRVVSGWGSADRGGAWTIGGGLANAAVVDGVGRLTGAPGREMTAQLAAVDRLDIALRADLALAEAASGGGTYVGLATRRVGTSDYRVTARFQAGGRVELRLDRLVGGAETILGSVLVPGTYVPGTKLTVAVEVSGSGTTTLKAKAWAAGAVEPGWMLTRTDTTADLQRPGRVHVESYTSGSATRASVLSVDALRAEPAGATEVPNTAPTAAFTSAATDLAVAVDGSGSADGDGRVVSHAWSFGDGATGSGATASHTYAAAGTYQVQLTVTDDRGATGIVTKAVTVTARPAPPATTALAADAFGREVAAGFGSADVGGAWTTSGAAGSSAVTAGRGSLTAAGGASTAAALGVSVQDVGAQVDVVLDRAATGGGSYVSLGTRNVGGTRYNAQLHFLADGRVDLSLVSVVSWAETWRAGVTLPGTYAPGTALTVRFEVSGSGTSTLRAKAWTRGTAEPGWQVQTTDSTAGLQRAGGLYVDVYTARSATAPSVVRLDDLWVGRAGETPPAR
jgi:trimeric autotransporter adhesin